MAAKKRIELSESGVVFNEAEHTYELGGRYLSGITGLLHRQLFPDEFENVPEEMLNNAASYGTTVHQGCEDFDMNWINDGTQEVADYIKLCQENNLIHERSEYTVTDGENYASNIDKVFRTSETTFDLADIKTYRAMTSDKLEKARWQLSIYAYLFELQNKKAKVGNLYILHIRNKAKNDGSFDHIAAIIPVKRIPSDICMDLLDADLNGEKFENPYGIPEHYRQKESRIRELMQQKSQAEAELTQIKAEILTDMEEKGVKTWATETMKLTRKLGSTRSTFDLNHFKEDHPELDYENYMKTSTISPSLTITV